MTFAYFASFHDRTDPAVQLSQADKTRVIDIVRTTPGLIRGLVFTPETTRDPYAHDGASPQLALELYFADIPELESALAPKGHLQALAAKEALPSLAGAQATQQAMLVRIFPVPEPAFRTPPGGLP